jgi:ergothioneine biosynthesis protein EgtB
MLSRPSLDEVRAYRSYVDEALDRALPDLPQVALELIELGINHEQQHQELFLTDILAVLAENPLEPAYGELSPPACFAVEPLSWHRGSSGVVETGAPDEGFAFDSERPRHRSFLSGHELASRRVTNKEWREFIEQDGYRTPTLWLSEGWDWVQREQISAPLYWRDEGTEFTLGGRRELDWAAPVAHVSFFEADAFARCAGARLPTEAEWEDFGASGDPMIGNQLDEAGPVLPRPGGGIFGDVWEWTQSAFASYPGFSPAEGAVGEYNGKFMCGQFVLKGASCATPRGHSRASYRNFFPPAARWQFTGLRLAKDA